MHALQDGAAAAAVDDFERAWKKMPPKDLRRWLVD
jgi:predicted amidohydrolase YtcJ